MAPSVDIVASLRDQFRMAPAGADWPKPSSSKPAIGESSASFAVGARIIPRFSAEARGVRHPAVVSYPSSAAGSFSVADTDTQVELALQGATEAPAAVDHGYVVYRGAWAGGDVVHRPTPAGTEDYVTIAAESDPGSLRYTLALGDRVAGLRLVERTLEVVDALGAPRIRMSPPYVVDANGKRHSATVAVSGCSFDENPAPPWKHPIVAPLARSCVVAVSWDRKSLAYPALVDPAWTTAGSLATARGAHVAVAYSDGTVVVTGGIDDAGMTIATSEVYNPTLDSWSATGSLLTAVSGAQATLVNNGVADQVLVVGGYDGAGMSVKSEVWDSGSGTWSYTAGDLTTGRAVAGLAKLASGKALVVGGLGASFVPTGGAELYDPSTGIWSPVGSISARGYVTATVLGSGEVLVVGGDDGTLSPTPHPVTTADLYDPIRGSWSSASPMNEAHYLHDAALLPAGNVLVVGGQTSSTSTYGAAEAYDRGSDSWTVVGSMTTPRDSIAGVVLGSGRYLAVGGWNQTADSAVAGSELYDQTGKSWTATGTVPGGGRYLHTVTYLSASKKTLVVGGTDGTTSTASTALYDYGTLGDPCSQGSDCTSGLCSAGSCALPSTDGGGFSAIMTGVTGDPDAGTGSDATAPDAGSADAGALPNQTLSQAAASGSGCRASGTGGSSGLPLAAALAVLLAVRRRKTG